MERGKEIKPVTITTYQIISAKDREEEQIVKRLLARHADAHILLIGVYLNQLEEMARELNAPLITGKIKNMERGDLYGRWDLSSAAAVDGAQLKKAKTLIEKNGWLVKI